MQKIYFDIEIIIYNICVSAMLRSNRQPKQAIKTAVRSYLKRHYINIVAFLFKIFFRLLW